jgi:hypothetical protein
VVGSSKDSRCLRAHPPVICARGSTDRCSPVMAFASKMAKSHVSSCVVSVVVHERHAAPKANQRLWCVQTVLAWPHCPFSVCAARHLHSSRASCGTVDPSRIIPTPSAPDMCGPSPLTALSSWASCTRMWCLEPNVKYAMIRDIGPSMVPAERTPRITSSERLQGTCSYCALHCGSPVAALTGFECSHFLPRVI